MPLPIPTPEELEAEALDLVQRADMKMDLAQSPWVAGDAEPLLRDVAIFREEAASKRAKAERMRKAAAQAEVDDAARHALEHEGAGQHDALDEANHFAQ